MSIALSLSLLAPSQLWGGIAFLLLFVICFIVVHAIKLSSLGYKVLRESEKKPIDSPEPEEKAPVETPAKRKKRRKTAQPIYYLVEKKRVKNPLAPDYESEAEYAPPRRVKFTAGKKDDYV